jgi:protein-S-isoprenylcysteine O-methyltransferase Ste14
LSSSRRAALGPALFFVLAPFSVAGLVPFWISHGWAGRPLAVWGVRSIAAGALAVAGLAFIADTFARFVRDGLGTPAPYAPTQRLVVSGIYRHVRNPMYLAVGAAIFGQALLLGSGRLATYGLAVVAAMAAFVRWYEEPALSRRFGAEYETYRRAVPRWWPRWRRYQG